MSISDPIVFAARAGGMTDEQLYESLNHLTPGEGLTDLDQAVLDEVQLRGILTSSEAEPDIAVQQSRS